MKQNLEKNQTHRKKEGRLGEEKRTRLTQKAIVEVAAELFARNGFGATSLDDIAEILGVTKPALYYHIKNKEEILRLICLLILNVAEEPLLHIVESDLPPVEKLRRAIEHHIAIAADRSPALSVFYREQQHLTGPFAKEIALRKKDYEHYFQRILEEGQATGAFKAIDSKIVTFGLLGMCHWLSQWYKPYGRYTPQQIAEIFANMIESGLIPSPPC
ncbi:MAG TPA: TetR/AcrR family transcriptional regulator [Ktedonobacteraceae bacterium]|nr:TetR/AcrR family transcriptional regulator [Ktedonobacteraceae bacterium]